MAYLENQEKNIFMTLNLLRNKYLDVEVNRSDYENWVPFELLLRVEGEQYQYSSEDGATFTVYELKKLVLKIEDIISKKINCESIEPYEFYSYEAFFDMIVYDTYDENTINVDLWINMGTLTDGNIFGYDKGFRFVVDLDIFIEFIEDLKKQLNTLINSI